MKVIKIGGGCLNGNPTIAEILDLIGKRGHGNIFVVSALYGVTDLLTHGMDCALADEDNIPDLINDIRELHIAAAHFLISDRNQIEKFSFELSRIMDRLERYFYGLNFTRELTPRMKDMITSFGERFSAILLTWVLRSKGLEACYRMPENIGIVTDGKYGDATANFQLTGVNLKKHLTPLVEENRIIFVPGFYGVSEEGEITTFGRGGSDYSAAVVAGGMKADILEVWKDVDGYMSADPRFVPSAKLIPKLSYEEAAELSYFGATILHPRTVEPLRKVGIDIAIKNTVDPDAQGSLITARSPVTGNVIKSVTYNTDIGIIKVYAAGVGTRPGILGEVATQLSGAGINIKATVTSQTCISLLLAREDMERSYRALEAIKPRPYRELEQVVDVALLSIVGEGLFHGKGIAARCFAAIADEVNVEMISFGPSKVAMYFLMQQKELNTAVALIHKTFFPEDDA